MCHSTSDDRQSEWLTCWDTSHKEVRSVKVIKLLKVNETSNNDVDEKCILNDDLIGIHVVYDFNEEH